VAAPEGGSFLPEHYERVLAPNPDFYQPPAGYSVPKKRRFLLNRIFSSGLNGYLRRTITI
jgi:hypothetical protein